MNRRFKLFSMLYSAIFLLAVFSASLLFADIHEIKGTIHHAPERDFSVINYTLHISFNPEQKTLYGKEFISLSPIKAKLDSVVLDAAEMKIESVKLPTGKGLKFRKTSDKLIIFLNRSYLSSDTVKISIIYNVTDAKKGLYFVLPDKNSKNPHFEIYTQGEEEENHYWFPCWDFPNDRATSEMFITTKKPNIAISNGKLINVIENKQDSTRTFHWKIDIPHVTYLTSFVAGNYKKFEDYYKKIPVQYYVHPDQEKYVKATFSKTPDMIKFFSDKIGIEYPYSKYAQTVVDKFMYGGMENISATTLTSGSLTDKQNNIDRTAESLISHELAHQWWGDLLTCHDWPSVWLNEGFATYFEALWKEHTLGRDAFDYEMSSYKNIYMMEDSTTYRRSLAGLKFQNHGQMLDRHSYQKGAWVLHMLRYVLGDELFWKGIHLYGVVNAGKVVGSDDLEKAFEEATNKNLHWFFNEWVYYAGYPKYVVNQSWIDSLKTISLRIQQKQIKEPLTTTFRMPVKIEVFTGSQKKPEKICIAAADTTILIKCKAKPELVLFDPGNNILKTIKFNKSKAEYLFQLAHADRGIDRIEALNKLQKKYKDDPDVQKAAALSMINDSFSTVRNNTARFLGEVRPKWAIEELKKAAHDHDSKVRASAVSALAKYKDASLVPFIQQIFAADSSLYVIGSSIRAIAQLDTAKALPVIKKALAMNSFNDKIRSAAIRAFSKLECPGMVGEILKYGTSENPGRLRTAVISAVSKYGKTHPEVVDYLISNLSDSSRWIKLRTISTLRKINKPEVIEAFKKATEKETDKRIKKSMQRAIKHLQRKKL
ncbi:HEAT repeat domain-containing protein [bacterium]|nr:HEAT repeat domain-containing protein [bacterium]